MTAPHPRAWPALALVFNALVWGLSWIAFKALHHHGLHPLWATALVYAGALAALLLWRPGGAAALLRHPRLLLLAAAAGTTNVSFNWSVAIGDVVRVVLLFYLMPLWSVGLAWWLLGERPTRAALVRLGLALAGVVLVLYRPPAGSMQAVGLADGLAVLGGLGFALTNVLLRRWRDTPEQARAVAMFFGGVSVSTAVALFVGASSGTLAPVAQWWPWVVALCLAFLAGNMALQYGAARLPAQATALIMLSEVVFASVSAVMLGAASPHAATWLGGALIMLAAVLAVPRGQSR